MTEQDFDKAAIKYDEEFSNSKIGEAQRAQVWNNLDDAIYESENCLELNCGTGEDALYFSMLGLKVTATDVSPEMVAITKNKIDHFSDSTCELLDINKINETDLNQRDMVFSNFGGLNCLSPEDWNKFGDKLQENLPSRARVIFVIMSKKCLWERVYFVLKGKKWDRNTAAPVEAHVSGTFVKTWYYSPQEISKFLSSGFEEIKSRPIGFFIPPSYLEPFFSKHTLLLKILSGLDKIVGRFGFLSNQADHFYIEFRKVAHG